MVCGQIKLRFSTSDAYEGPTWQIHGFHERDEQYSPWITVDEKLSIGSPLI